MRYFVDLEFCERGRSPIPTIDLISIGVVASDGRELYCVSSDWSMSRVNPWVRDNVLPHLDVTPDQWISNREIRRELLDFIGDDQVPEFWGYYCAYDWVRICWLFGDMIELPDHFPKLCMDLQQWWIHLGRPDVKPPTPEKEHNALADARWNRDLYDALANYGLDL